MPRLLITLVLFILVHSVLAQMHDGKFGNEWINHGQSYYKMKIAEDGFYHLDKQVLNRDIENFDQIPAQQLQLFCMGEQIPLYVHAPNGIVEYLEFYAEGNKGHFDINLYKNPHHHFNPSYSLITDTASYFLTWSTSPSQQYQNQSSDFNNLPQKETYFMYKSEKSYFDTWNKGLYHKIAGTDLSKGSFDCGEGYGSPFTKQKTVNIKSPHALNLIYTNATINIRGYSSSYQYHQLKVTVNNSNYNFPPYYSDSLYSIDINVPSNTINNSITNIDIAGTINSMDLHSISRVSLRYPRSYNFEGKSTFKFELQASSNKRYLEINNFDGGPNMSQNVFLYDITNKLRIHCFWDGSMVRAVLPASTTTCQLIMVNVLKTRTIHYLTKTHFENYTFARGNFVVITHPSLFNDSEGNNPIHDYCTYRASTGEVPSIHSVLELYDQFSYGISGHPMAIKNFAAYINLHWQNIKPKNIFLIGKGRIYNSIRNSVQTNNLVPTFGSPPSDNLLLAPIDSDIPIIPVGRLAATNGDDVRIYLNKIKQLEHNAKNSVDYKNQHWRKQIIHLGGGANPNEQSLFKNYLSNLRTLVNDGKSGSNVNLFSKSNLEHTSIPNSKKIDSLINNGVSMITFFGHGSTKSFDYYLNTPDYYNNKSKYPLILALGCYNGTVFEQDKLMSENFIFQKDAGASSYISFVNAVFAHCANTVSEQFYTHCHTDMYGQGIGAIVQQTLIDLSDRINYSDMYQLTSNYLILHGDPALKLHYKNSPDYFISPSTISTLPQNITNNLQNFKLVIDVHNWGTYEDTTLRIKVIRTHPLGSIDTSYINLESPKAQKRVEIIIPINGYEDLGLNKFSIFVDDDNRITELPAGRAEENNIVLEYQVQVGNAQATAIYPKDFAIINDTALTLKATTTNAFENNHIWSVELDTTNTFDSPVLITKTINTNNNIIEWSPSISLKNKQVYYWRVKSENIQRLTSGWSENSFIYIANATSEGWNQSHVYQYHKNNFNKINVSDDNNRPFHFIPSTYEISIKTGFIPDALNANDLALFQNGSKVDKCRCSSKNGVYAAVFDPQTLTFWTLAGNTSQYGAINCDAAGRTAYAFLFETNTSAGQQNLSEFVLNTIPADHIVILYTLNNGFGGGWKSDLVNYLKNKGATKINDYIISDGNIPYAVSFKKNNSYPCLSEGIGTSKQSIVNINNTAKQEWHEGSMTSPLIGPAQYWHELEWKTTSMEAQADSVSVDVLGINLYGETTVLYNNLINSRINLSSIDPTSYPYLQLKINNEDKQNRTPAKLDYWRVWGEMTKDLALTINNGNSLLIDSINNTNNIKMNILVSNLGPQYINNAELQIFLLGGDTLKYSVPPIHNLSSVSVSVNLQVSGLRGQQHLVAKLLSLDNESNLSNNWGWLDFYVQETGSNVSLEDIEPLYDIKNYPNPFISQTRIEFDFKTDIPEQVQIDIYDTKAVLITSYTMNANKSNSWVWNGNSQNTSEVPSGLYYCRITPLNSTDALAYKFSPQVIRLIKK
ncbi:C25 family cysteine peptidase [Aureispira]|nr:C25 family cysteine peptidase [Aureispira sp.]